MLAERTLLGIKVIVDVFNDVITPIESSLTVEFPQQPSHGDEELFRVPSKQVEQVSYNLLGERK